MALRLERIHGESPNHGTRRFDGVLVSAAVHEEPEARLFT
jgi:hypothetical protein